MKFVENFYLTESRKWKCYADRTGVDGSKTPQYSAVLCRELSCRLKPQSLLFCRSPHTLTQQPPRLHTTLLYYTNVVVLLSGEKIQLATQRFFTHTTPNEIDIQSSLRFGAVQLLSRIWKVAFWHLHQAGLLHRISTGVITIKLDKAQHDKKAPN